MNKIYKIVVLMLVSITLLVGCSDPEEVDKPVVEAPVEKPVESKPETDKPIDSPVDSKYSMSVVEREYITDLLRITKQVSEGLSSMAGLTSNPTYTEQWTKDVVRSLVKIESGANEFLSQGNPPEKYIAVHAYNKLAMKEFLNVTLKTPRALDTMDTELLNEVIGYIRRGGDYTKLATEELNKIILQNEEGK